MNIVSLKKYFPIGLVFIVWRLFLFLPLLIGSIFLPYRNGYGFTNIWIYVKPYFPVSHPLMFPWANFDGVHYLAIAGQGYTDNGRFFPFYPLLIKIGTLIFGSPPPFGTVYFVSAFMISNFSLLLSLVIFYKLMRLDYSEKIALYSSLFMLFFPTSFFLGSIYSESVFLLVCLLSFYFARKEKWFLSGLFGLFASLTRVIGIIMFPVLFVEFVKSKQKNNKQFFFILLAPLGIVIYAIYNWIHWGNPFKFLILLGDLNDGRTTTSFVFPLQTVYRYIKIIVSVSPIQYEWWIAVLELGVFFFVFGLIVVMWKKRMKLSYRIFTILGILIPVLSGTLSGLPRYILPLFPLFLCIALIENRLFRMIYMIIGIILSCILLIFFSRGYYIA